MLLLRAEEGGHGSGTEGAAGPCSASLAAAAAKRGAEVSLLLPLTTGKNNHIDCCRLGVCSCNREG